MFFCCIACWVLLVLHPLKTHMTGWKITTFYRKCIDSFIVDFPATHVSFRGNKRLLSTGFNPHPLRVGALENAGHLLLNCLEKGDAGHQNLWLQTAWNCLAPNLLFQLDDFKPLHRKWLEITISIHFTTNRLVWGSR